MSVMARSEGYKISWISRGDCLSILVVPEYVNEYVAQNTI